MSDSTQEEAHTGPIKTPVQLLWAALFAFVGPVVIITALVYYVVSDTKPAGSNVEARYLLGGITAEDLERGVTERIQKVGTVEIRDANRPLQTGEAVFKAQCAACHVSGAAGAPKLGDAGDWTARIRTGFESLVTSALKGKGAMAPQAGGDFEDVEIARAVAYLANSAGGNFPEPDRPAAADGAAAAAAPAAANGAAAAAAPAAPAAPAASAPAAAAPAPQVAAAPQAAPMPAPAGGAPAAVAGGSGEALYKQACMACHAAGVAGAPKLGDKAAWASRLPAGLDGLTQSVIKGKGVMPPKGGAVAASEAQLREAVQYMIGTVQ